MGYDHLQLSTQSLYDRAAKAGRSPKTVRYHMKEQRTLSESGGNNNLNQESDPEREN